MEDAMSTTQADETDDRTIGEKVADQVTAFGGSWKAIFVGLSFLLAWSSINILLAGKAFDPYPFMLLNVFLSMVAAFQAPFIMMSQNRSEKKQDEAYRTLFKEIKLLVIKDIAIEKKILKVLEQQAKREGNPPL
jgi:uncharacterized membrane protein